MPFSIIDSLNPRGRRPGTAAALLTGVLASAMDAIMTVDEGQKIVIYNRAAEELFGWSPQEILGRSLDRLIPDRFRESHARLVSHCGKSDVTSPSLGKRRIMHGLRRNGEEFPVEASISMLDTPEGKLFTVIVRDITEIDRLQRAQAESHARLVESQSRLQKVQRLARIGYWQNDLDTGQTWWCNEACDVLGVERGLLDGPYTALVKIVHPADRQAYESERDAAIEGGLPRDIEFRVITSADEVRWIHLAGSVDCNDDGQPLRRRTGMVREITGRKRSERVLAHNVDLLDRTGALARVGGWEVVMATMALHGSAEIYRIFEIESSARGALKDFLRFYAPVAQPAISAAVLAAMQDGTPWDLDLQLITAKGQHIWVRTQGRAELVDGKVVRLFGVLQDITEIKTVEAALRLSNKELESFSYSVSHDLRSPLKTINGFSLLLGKKLAGDTDPKVQHYLSRIQAGTAHMEQLIEGLLSLTQVSRAVLRSEPVDLSMISRSILDDCQARHPGRKLMANVEYGLQARGDARLVKAVMENLLGNAWKFSSKKACAEIAVGQIPGSAESPVFFVRDNGAGFDMAHVDKLFSPFERLHEDSEFPGMGIGLATVSRIIERHHGRLWAESVAGCGASFFFTLPAGAVQ